MVTFRVSNRTPEVAGRDPRYAQQDEHWLASLQQYRAERCTRILQATEWNKETFHTKESGFVYAVTDAYNYHHNLVIRPDDVWLAIAVQFGLYVNGNAEKLRSLFVEHDGKKELVVVGSGHLYSADYGRLASKMSSELHKNVKDKELCSWILPSFSTTTKNDVIVGSVVLMATLKSYFSYRFHLCCGIPYVTMLGTPEDWEEIHNRVSRLDMYGKDCKKWSIMLKEITGKLVESSKGNVDVGFWNRICHYTGGGSGPRYISGWISVFCVFNQDGKWQGDDCFKRRCERFRLAEDREEENVDLNETAWPHIDTNSIPPGYLVVDVVVDDNGKESETLMFAGHMGYDVVEHGKSLAPKVAWAITLKDKPKETSSS